MDLEPVAAFGEAQGAKEDVEGEGKGHQTGWVGTRVWRSGNQQAAHEHPWEPLDMGEAGQHHLNVKLELELLSLKGCSGFKTHSRPCQSPSQAVVS